MISKPTSNGETNRSLLASMTLEEKALLLGGKNMWETEGIPRLGIKSLKTTDGPAGVRGARWTGGTASTYIPCGISLAATFDPALIERIGQILGEETRSKNAHVLLAPTINMSRSPFGGRNFENFGEDPYLTGVIATSIVNGIQSQGVGACPKHYVGNEQESRRFNIDERVDERTLREVYLKPFQMICDADPWTFMTAYNKINGEHCDVSKRLLQDILRDEWGFRGATMSDWGGLNDTVQSVLAGTDLEMPGPPIRRGKKLLDAVKKGGLKETDLDACVERMLDLLERAGCISKPGDTHASSGISAGDRAINADEGSADRVEVRQKAKEAATGAIVLLQNDGILPLSPSKIGSLAILGPNAKTPSIGGAGSAIVNPYYISTPYNSIADMVKKENPDIKITHESGILTHKMLPLPGNMIKTTDGSQGVRLDFYEGRNFEGKVVGSRDWAGTQIFLMSDGDQPECLRGRDYCFRVTGKLSPPKSGRYIVGIQSTGKAKLFVNDKLTIDNSDWTKLGEGFMNCGSEERRAELDFVAGESCDIRIDQIGVPPPGKPHDNTLFHTLSGTRFGILPPVNEEAMFTAAVKAAKEADVAILVVGHNNGTEREGSDRTSLSLPGRTADLVRAVSAANKRTIVVNQSACAVDLHSWREQPSAILQAWYQGQETGNAIADVILGRTNPSGKLPITFPVRKEDHGSDIWFPGDVENDFAEYGEGTLIGYRWFDKQKIQPAWEFGFGLSYTSFQLSDITTQGLLGISDGAKARISLTVHNTGDIAGAEVVQVYATPSQELAAKGLEAAPKILVAFKKVAVGPSASQSVTMDVDKRAIEWYDVESNSWRADPGMYLFWIGTSSRALKGSVQIEAR